MGWGRRQELLSCKVKKKGVTQTHRSAKCQILSSLPLHFNHSLGGPLLLLALMGSMEGMLDALTPRQK